MTGMIEIDRLRLGDRAAWEVLARGYKAFYQDPEGNARARALYDQVARFTGFIRYVYPL